MTMTLFLGGARSGKSRLAQEAAERCEGPLRYLATGEARDAEMADRIARHRADRGARWTTVECPVDLPGALAATPPGTGAVLVDCLTLWLSNLMCAGDDAERAGAALLAALAAVPVPVMVVANEVGMGIVPATPLGRAFRDAAGRLNQRVAAAADSALLIVAGLVLPLHRADAIGARV